MAPYHLAKHAYACVMPGGAVFLDIRRDCYFAIDVTQAEALAAHVEGWPSFTSASVQANEVTFGLADALCEKGLLVREAGAGRPTHLCTLSPADAELIPWEYMPWQHIHLGHIYCFAHAFLVALAFTQCRSLEATVRRHQQRRARAASKADDIDLQRARELVSAYHHIRLWVFARRGRCLLDSLALLEFLSLFGVHPLWVIGVQMRPFSAHSWIQHDHWVLNGTPTFVRGYSPILVV